MKSLLGSVCLLFAVALGMSACGEAEELFNCAEVCEAYADCAEELGEDVDEISCTDECEDAVDRDPELEEALSECGQCLDREADTCVESLPCADECARLVPEIAL